MTQDNPNVGQQFKDIIGHSLITDSMDRISALKSLVKPHADVMFSDPMASDKEILEYPAVETHNKLVIAHMNLEHALSLHDSGMGGFIQPIIHSHLSLMGALRAALNVSELKPHHEEIAEHFQKVTENFTKLAKLNSEEQT
jgi:hypothetical protein